MVTCEQTETTRMLQEQQVVAQKRCANSQLFVFLHMQAYSEIDLLLSLRCSDVLQLVHTLTLELFLGCLLNFDLISHCLVMNFAGGIR